jgi:hypothetical protein
LDLVMKDIELEEADNNDVEDRLQRLVEFGQFLTVGR